MSQLINNNMYELFIQLLFSYINNNSLKDVEQKLEVE